MDAPRELFVLIEDDGDPYRAFSDRTDAFARVTMAQRIRQVHRYVLVTPEMEQGLVLVQAALDALDDALVATTTGTHTPDPSEPESDGYPYSNRRWQ